MGRMGRRDSGFLVCDVPLRSFFYGGHSIGMSLVFLSTFTLSMTVNITYGHFFFLKHSGTGSDQNYKISCKR